MALQFNVRHLERNDQHLQGELAAEELNLDIQDELVHPHGPLKYDLTVQQAGASILARGSLECTFKCECVRCLKSFELPLKFQDWICSLDLEGEDKVLISNDCVDLTPYLREDILLEFPQHPLCKPECNGLPESNIHSSGGMEDPGSTDVNSSVWKELNKLKF